VSGILSDSATNQSLLCESTENFLTGLAQALRAFQFYGASNPAALRSLSTARTACQNIWEHAGEIELTIQETSITLGDKVVYQNDEHSQSLSFLLYKDGVRALRLLKGFEDDDLEPLLLILHKAKHLRNEEDDLITLLWSADFSKIFYSYIDIGEYDEPQLQDVENTGTSFSRALAANTLAATTASQPDAANTAEHAGSADPAPLAEEDNDPADGSDAAVAMSMEELNYLQVEMAPLDVRAQAIGRLDEGARLLGLAQRRRHRRRVARCVDRIDAHGACVAQHDVVSLGGSFTRAFMEAAPATRCSPRHRPWQRGCGWR
jgi:hypothetical protein